MEYEELTLEAAIRKLSEHANASESFGYPMRALDRREISFSKGFFIEGPNWKEGMPWGSRAVARASNWAIEIGSDGRALEEAWNEPRPRTDTEKKLEAELTALRNQYDELLTKVCGAHALLGNLRYWGTTHVGMLSPSVTGKIESLPTNYPSQNTRPEATSPTRSCRGASQTFQGDVNMQTYGVRGEHDKMHSPEELLSQVDESQQESITRVPQTENRNDQDSRSIDGSFSSSRLSTSLLSNTAASISSSKDRQPAKQLRAESHATISTLAPADEVLASTDSDEDDTDEEYLRDVHTAAKSHQASYSTIPNYVAPKHFVGYNLAARALRSAWNKRFTSKVDRLKTNPDVEPVEFARARLPLSMMMMDKGGKWEQQAKDAFKTWLNAGGHYCASGGGGNAAQTKQKKEMDLFLNWAKNEILKDNVSPHKDLLRAEIDKELGRANEAISKHLAKSNASGTKVGPEASSLTRDETDPNSEDDGHPVRYFKSARRTSDYGREQPIGEVHGGHFAAGKNDSKTITEGLKDLVDITKHAGAALSFEIAHTSKEIASNHQEALSSEVFKTATTSGNTHSKDNFNAGRASKATTTNSYEHQENLRVLEDKTKFIKADRNQQNKRTRPSLPSPARLSALEPQHADGMDRNESLSEFMANVEDFKNKSTASRRSLLAMKPKSGGPFSAQKRKANDGEWERRAAKRVKTTDDAERGEFTENKGAYEGGEE